MKRFLSIILVLLTLLSVFSASFSVLAEKSEAYNFNIETTPPNAIVQVYDAQGERIESNVDGSFSGSFASSSYTYTVTAYAYVGQSGVVPSAGGEIAVNLIPVEDDGLSDTGAYWRNFRNSDANMAITDAMLPIQKDETGLLWNKKLGAGWNDSPSVQIIVDDALVVMSETNIYKLDLKTGDILVMGTMCAAPNFGYTPPIYAEGMIFAPLSNGTIQAFNAETLESLWIYNDTLKGQALSPIAYSDGYIYIGFWRGESKTASFVALSVTDEDITKSDEKKLASWKHIHLGGFYWAGAVVIGDAVIVGTDDGQSGYDGASKLYSFNKYTGAIINELDLKGDQRSCIAYEAISGKIYFTTKCGYLYSADVDAVTGMVSDLSYVSLNAQLTGTPLVYKGRVYVGAGSGVSTMESTGKILVADAESLEILFSIPLIGYPQCSMLLCNAYEADTGYLYLYSTYNAYPGGISMIKVEADAKSEDDAQLIELYSAVGFEQYCISSIICGSDGTMYYKNDSGNVLAVGVSRENTNESSIEKTKSVTDDATYEAENEAVALMKKIDSLFNAERLDKYEIIDAYKKYLAMSSKLKAEVFNYDDLKTLIDKLGVENHRDEATGMEIEGLEWYIETKIEEVTHGNVINSLSNLIGSNSLIKVWNIEFVDLLTSEKYHPDAKLRVRVAAPDISACDQIYIVHYDGYGRPDYYECVLKNDCIEWQAQDFSYYALIGGKALQELKDDEIDIVSKESINLATPLADSRNPLLWLWIFIACLGASAMSAVLIIKHRRKVEPKNDSD